MVSLIKNWFPLSYTTFRIERLFSLKVRGLQKSQLVNWRKPFSELEKIWKCSLSYPKIPIFYFFHELGKVWKNTQSKTNISKFEFWIYGWIRKSYLCPNLSFTVFENKMMGNSHRNRWLHFKINKNGWDIPFPKISRIY